MHLTSLNTASRLCVSNGDEDDGFLDTKMVLYLNYYSFYLHKICLNNANCDTDALDKLFDASPGPKVYDA